MSRSRSVDPALAREAAITRQQIETPKDGAAAARITRYKSGVNAGDEDGEGDDDNNDDDDNIDDDDKEVWVVMPRCSGDSLQSERSRYRDRSAPGPSVR